MKLSVITINYNNALGLKKTIESIITQKSNCDFEYLIIDGNSNDNSVDIIKSYSAKIDFWMSEPDTGIYNAMNKAIAQAKGEYLLFINSGDIIRNEIYLTNIVDKVNNEDIVYFDLEIKDSDTNDSYVKEYPNKLDVKYFLGDSLPHAASFIKKEILLEYGSYDESLRIVSDWAFFMDVVIKYNCSFKRVNESFSIFFNDGISSKYENRQLVLNERDMHIKKSYPLLYSLYAEWAKNKTDLYRIKTAKSVSLLKRIGFLKWLKD